MVIASPAAIYAKLFRFHGRRGNLVSLCILYFPDGIPGQSYYDYIYNFAFLILTYGIPIVVMVFAYFRMSRVLWPTSDNLIGEQNPVLLEAMSTKRRVVRLLIIVAAIFATCWLPYHVYFLYTYHNRDIMMKSWIQHVYLGIYLLAMSNAACNPIIYALISKR